eukprot:gene2842-5679_t
MVIPIFVFSLVQYQADFFQAVTLHPWNKMEMESNEAETNYSEVWHEQTRAMLTEVEQQSDVFGTALSEICESIKSSLHNACNITRDSITTYSHTVERTCQSAEESMKQLQNLMDESESALQHMQAAAPLCSKM